MNLPQLIASFDDAALAVLANKGLLRRAHRDVQAGKVIIETFTDNEAGLVVADYKVSIPVEGSAGATCDCPAEGVCFHILAAIIALREIKAPKDSGAKTARAFVRSLPEKALRKFAGADWSGAGVLADNAPNFRFCDEGANCAVTISQPAASVTFIGAGGLKQALYKGPKSRKRLLVTSAALALRDLAGIARKTPVPVAAAFDDFTHIRAALARALTQATNGAAKLASERLFDLAISTRIQKMPRLTGQLLLLSRQAEWAAEEHISYDEATFLALLSQTYALTIALEHSDANPDLTGVFRREYHPAPPLKLLFLGADKWQTDTGVRGLTLFGYDPDNIRFYTATMARAAGMDPGFTPEQAYRTPIWGVGEAEALIGHWVSFKTPSVSADFQLSVSQNMGAELDGTIRLPADLKTLEGSIDDWAIINRTTAGVGLRHAAQAHPFLMAPSGAGEVVFDDFSQTWGWPVFDKNGVALNLSVAPKYGAAMRRLAEHPVKRTRLLVIVQRRGLEKTIKPVAAFFQSRTDPRHVNLSFDKMPAAGKAGKIWTRVMQHTPPAPDLADSPAHFARETLYALSEIAGGFGYDKLDAICKQAEARNLLSLAQSLSQIKNALDCSQILRAAYLCAMLMV
ncbi:MAG: hypothetical protein GQ535_15075 [Rhodobacteraceae bacterium]|nr:hypothetical protein [Paracoccaceae bacterium]